MLAKILKSIISSEGRLTNTQLRWLKNNRDKIPEKAKNKIRETIKVQRGKSAVLEARGAKSKIKSDKSATPELHPPRKNQLEDSLPSDHLPSDVNPKAVRSIPDNIPYLKGGEFKLFDAVLKKHDLKRDVRIIKSKRGGAEKRIETIFNLNTQGPASASAIARANRDFRKVVARKEDLGMKASSKTEGISAQKSLDRASAKSRKRKQRRSATIGG